MICIKEITASADIIKALELIGVVLMEARKTGYYWVKEIGDTDWSVAYFTEQEYMQPWLVCGTGRGYYEHDFSEINEQRINAPHGDKK